MFGRKYIVESHGAALRIRGRVRGSVYSTQNPGKAKERQETKDHGHIKRASARRLKIHGIGSGDGESCQGKARWRRRRSRK